MAGLSSTESHNLVAYGSVHVHAYYLNVHLHVHVHVCLLPRSSVKKIYMTYKMYNVAINGLFILFLLHVNSFKETRQSKQLRLKTTPFFLERKSELPWAGFEPATFCVLGERSTN